MIPGRDHARTTGEAPGVGNVADLVATRIAVRPGHPALVVPRAWDERRALDVAVHTYGELGVAMTAWQHRLAEAGTRPGHRVLMLAGLDLDFYAAALAVLAAGCTVVLVDRGMSRRRIRSSLAAVAPDVVVVAPELRWLLRVVPELHRIPRVVPVPAPGTTPVAAAGSPPAVPCVPRAAEDEAIITFTSGTTGRPKGADRTHGTLLAQHHSLRRALPAEADDVAVSAWPVVVMHGLLSGTTSVLPPVRPGHLAEVSGEVVLALAVEHGVTQLLGPPAFLRPVLERAAGRGARPALRRIVASGGPVDAALCRLAGAAFPAAEHVVLYGSTEAEPVALCAMEDVLAEPGTGRGGGLLVGLPVPDIDVRILPIERPASEAANPSGWGEIAYAGAHVLPRWFHDPVADRATRVRIETTDFLRSGDSGRIDGGGRLWLGGPVASLLAHRGQLVAPYEIEPQVDALDGVERCALVAGDHGLVLYVDTGGRSPVPAGVPALLARLGLADVEVRGPCAVPVDGRHESKVDRVGVVRPAVRIRSGLARRVRQARRARHRPVPLPATGEPPVTPRRTP